MILVAVEIELIFFQEFWYASVLHFHQLELLVDLFVFEIEVEVYAVGGVFGADGHPEFGKIDVVYKDQHFLPAKFLLEGFYYWQTSRQHHYFFFRAHLNEVDQTFSEELVRVEGFHFVLVGENIVDVDAVEDFYKFIFGYLLLDDLFADAEFELEVAYEIGAAHIGGHEVGGIPEDGHLGFKTHKIKLLLIADAELIRNL